jgi:hypothetical protein
MNEFIGVALKPSKIKRLYGIDERTLKTMRDNPRANNGDVPEYFIVCNRPHYPSDKFQMWLQRQKKRTNKNVNTVISVNKDKTALVDF